MRDKGRRAEKRGSQPGNTNMAHEVDELREHSMFISRLELENLQLRQEMSLLNEEVLPVGSGISLDQLLQLAQIHARLSYEDKMMYGAQRCNCDNRGPEGHTKVTGTTGDTKAIQGGSQKVPFIIYRGFVHC
jgi:hypothetical protein